MKVFFKWVRNEPDKVLQIVSYVLIGVSLIAWFNPALNRGSDRVRPIDNIAEIVK